MRGRLVAAGLGLLVACADPEIVAVSRLDATVDQDGPYVVEAIVRGAAPSDRVDLIHALEADAPTELPMDERDDEVYAAAIPGPGAPTTVRYHVVVVRDGDVVARAPRDGELAFDVLE